jgi:pyruvate dehydrogenase (quinone)
MGYSVAEVIIDGFVKAGIKRIYGLPGDSLNPMMDAIRRSGKIDFVQVRHEEGAALAASFEAKATGKPTVCMGTSGPGSIHLLNGLFEAKMDHLPVIALTGQIETDLMGTDYFQEVDMMGLFNTVTVYGARIINPKSAATLTARAIREAVTRRGVAHLDLPVDVLKMQAELGKEEIYAFPSPPSYAPDLEKIEKMIENSIKPVIMYGNGARGFGELLLNFAKKIGAPLIYALNGKGIIPDSEEQLMGGLGLLGSRSSVDAMKGCDLLILLGTSFPYVTFLPERVNIIQVDTEPSAIGKRISPSLYAICTVEYFLKAVSVKEKMEKYSPTLLDSRKEWLSRLETAENKAGEPLKPEAVASMLSRKLKQGTTVIADTGNVTVWGARNLRLPYEYRFLISPWLGSMGVGIPGSIGASFGSEGEVVALIGDGSFAMSMVELITARKYNRPVKLIVFDNGKLGMIKFEEEVMGYPEFGVDLLNPDFVKVADSLGIPALRVERGSELEESMEKFLSFKGPAVLSVKIDPDEKPMPPKLSFKQAKGYVTSLLREKLEGVQ